MPKKPGAYHRPDNTSRGSATPQQTRQRDPGRGHKTCWPVSLAWRRIMSIDLQALGLNQIDARARGARCWRDLYAD